MSSQPDLDPYGGTEDTQYINQEHNGQSVVGGNYGSSNGNNNNHLNSYQQQIPSLPIQQDYPNSPILSRNDSNPISSPLLRDNSTEGHYTSNISSSPPRFEGVQASGNIYSNERPLHLRQRSLSGNVPASSNQSHQGGNDSANSSSENPFRSPPRAFRAALMDGSENGDNSSENEHSAARDVRNERAEWVSIS